VYSNDVKYSTVRSVREIVKLTF